MRASVLLDLTVSLLSLFILFSVSGPCSLLYVTCNWATLVTLATIHGTHDCLDSVDSMMIWVPALYTRSTPQYFRSSTQ